MCVRVCVRLCVCVSVVCDGVCVCVCSVCVCVCVCVVCVCVCVPVQAVYMYTTCVLCSPESVKSDIVPSTAHRDVQSDATAPTTGRPDPDIQHHQDRVTVPSLPQKTRPYDIIH